MRIYLDHNATTPLDSRVRDAMVQALDQWGNPSSVHAEGRAARDLVETARRQVAALLGSEPDAVVFTSGGTEAAHLGVIGLARAARAAGCPLRVATTAIEHPAVLGAVDAVVAEGFERLVIPVDGAGRLDQAALERECRDGLAVLAVSLANHEIGTVQDVALAARAVRAAGGHVFCDAVQAAGKLPLAVSARPERDQLDVDAVAISAHKLHGPTGAGALWVRDGVDLGPVVAGGHQERGRRPGTEAVAAVVGMGAAAELALAEGLVDQARVRGLADDLERGLLALPGGRVTIHGAAAPRVGNTVSAGFEGALGEVVVTALDLAGVSAATGAACTSGSVEPSPVLLALGVPPARAREAVRFSLGRGNQPGDIEAVLSLLPQILSRAREHAEPTAD